MQILDAAFDAFMANTLSFEQNYHQGQHKDTYKAALRQLRLGIKQGGFGLTSQALIAPAALYVALTNFSSWLCNHRDEFGSIPWLATASQHEHMFPSVEALSNEALAYLDPLGLEHIETLPQFAISSALKTAAFNDLTTLLQNQPDALHRLSDEQSPRNSGLPLIHVPKYELPKLMKIGRAHV